ncbi:MAG: PQQ-binding-like beta-propeller repeat protein [Acidobacteria bacterium]|nr:PQQ-binding-like beta-propeller repeat protein [Acidobacteriota bacterium]
MFRIYSPHSFITRGVALAALVLLCASASVARADSPSWAAKLDGEVRFYLPTEMGVLVVGTGKSLYALDSATGEALWRRKDARLRETDVAPVPGTDLLLLSFERDDRTRVEAADLLTGDTLWRGDKLRGAVMQVAVEPDADLLAVVFARDAEGQPREGFKRRPHLHVFDLATGEELWKHEVGSEVEMMPARWGDGGEVEYTLDNYRPPAFLDGRLYLFYEGATSFDARTGRERTRERFRVNEEGLALTEAEPVADEGFVYTSGRGRVRAVSRSTGEVEWEAKDLGLTPELVLAGRVLYVRTGGQFTRLKDGEISERGPYGVSAIDARTGRVLWRWKGADKGITNLALPDSSTVLVADRDDLIALDAATGKRRARSEHGVRGAAFIILNEGGEAVVGGREESNLQSLATSSAREYGARRFRAFGLASRVRGIGSGVGRVRVPSGAELAARRAPDVEERLLDRLDPARQLERLSRFLWHRDRLAALRGEWMYFYTDLKGRSGGGGHGLAGVNINTGRAERAVPLEDPDERFIADETSGLLYLARKDRLYAYTMRNGGR